MRTFVRQHVRNAHLVPWKYAAQAVVLNQGLPACSPRRAYGATCAWQQSYAQCTPAGTPRLSSTRTATSMLDGCMRSIPGVVRPAVPVRFATDSLFLMTETRWSNASTMC